MFREGSLIEATGIAHDYWNEYAGRWMTLGCERHERVQRSFQESPVKKYAERFSQEDISDVITPKNRAAVFRLDEIADLVNAQACDIGSYNSERIYELMEEARTLIYGPDP